VSWRIVVQEQNALNQFAPPFMRDILTQTFQFVCIVRTVYGILLKIVNHDYSLTFQKIETIIFPADGTPYNFFGGPEPGCFHCMLCFWILDRSDGPMFHPEYDPVGKARFTPVARQKISCLGNNLAETFGMP
jgi:hypothetical protein